MLDALAWPPPEIMLWGSTDLRWAIISLADRALLNLKEMELVVYAMMAPFLPFEVKWSRRAVARWPLPG